MLKKLCPNLHAFSVNHIDLDGLKKNGYKYLLLDLDNTIVPWGEYTILPDVQQWIETAVNKGFKLCIVSNSTFKRTSFFADKFNIPFICKALKPLGKPFLKALSIMDGKTLQAVMIGDQVFTDILGANRLGIFTVLVKPVHNRELFTTKIMRLLERIVINLLKKRGIFPEKIL